MKSINISSKTGYKVTINAVHSNKIPLCHMLIRIDTTEQDLLYSLGMRFCRDKLHIKSIPGVNGIVIVTTDNKITSTISEYVNYINRIVLKSKQLFGKQGSYKKLIEDCKKTLTVTIVGKCKTFIKNNLQTNQESNKIKNLLQSLDSIPIKDRSDVVNDKYNEDCNGNCKSIVIDNCNDINLVDLIIIYRDLPVRITRSGSKVVVDRTTDYINYEDSIKTYLKLFRSQSGRCGVPSRPNEKKTKEQCKQEYEEKCNNILLCVNTMVDVYSQLRGIKCKPLMSTDLSLVDKTSIEMIKRLK